MLTGKDLTIALIKAASSNIPVAGPFISEGIGALDNRSTIDELENRIKSLECVLLEFGFVKSDLGSKERVASFHHTDNFGRVMDAFEASLNSSESFEKYIIKIDEAPPPEFEYFCNGVKIKIVHDILRRLERVNIDISDKARQALISFASKTVAIVKTEDDFLVQYSKGLSPNEMVNYGYLADAWHALGRELLISLKYHDAIRCFIRAVELGADPMVPLLNIANAFLSMGNVAYAVDKYETLIKIYPFSLQIRYRLASGLERIDELEKARENYEILIHQYDERLKEGANFPETTQLWRQLAYEFVDKSNKKIQSTSCVGD